MHKSGNKYLIGGEYCILSQFRLNLQDYVVLIILTDGNRWVDPIPVPDFRHITNEEFNLICKGYEAELLTDKITI